MKTRILALLISVVSFQSFGICQNQTNDCNEKAGSGSRLFVFIGQLLHAKTVPATDHVNEARFSATYKIIERVCGSYSRDTITFDVIQTSYDSSFKKNKYQLLMLTRNIEEDKDYVLWGGLYFDVFKTSNKQWAGSYMVKHYEVVYGGQKSFEPREVRFSKEAFYDTKGMTKEEIDVTYPEPFYRIKTGKAIPLLGNSIDEIVQYQKEGTLAYAGIYDEPEDTTVGLVIKEVELEEFKKEDADSIKQAIERDYKVIKDSLLKNPFNETQIQLLIENCSARKEYSYCSQFFDDLIRDYPDSARTYLIKAKFRHSKASLEDSSRISVLEQALKVDSSNYEAHYDLALSYYRLFRQKPNTYYANTARKWFIKCIDIDTTQEVLLKYPVIQLSNYLNDAGTTSIYKKRSYRVNTNAEGIPMENRYNWYFPVEPFLKDKRDWLTDSNIDIMQKLEGVTYSLNWFSEQLAWFKEPRLNIGGKEKVYRFLWLRTFDEPIVIRMQKNKRNVMIYWKQAMFNDSLQIFQSWREGRTKITIRQWKKFEKSLIDIDYWSMISPDYLSNVMDGAIWLLEGSSNGKYNVVERQGYIYPGYTECLKYLISLTDLNLPKDRIY